MGTFHRNRGGIHFPITIMWGPFATGALNLWSPACFLLICIIIIHLRVVCPHPEPDIFIQELRPVHVMRAVAGEVQADDAVKDVQ